MDGWQRSDQENAVLRWGGLAGILGSVLFIFVFVFVGMIVGMEPGDLEGMVVRFPEIREARIVENGAYLAVLILWVTHFLALYRALRGTNLAPALFGSVVGILGLAVLAAGALPHVATAPISDLYHAPGATPQDQATLVLMWQATQGIFDALFVAGLLFLPIGLIALGVAMLGTPAFGKGIGRMSVALGIVGAVAGAALLIDPASPIAVVGVFALIAFHLVLGRRLRRLSRAAPGVAYAGAPVRASS